MILFLAKCSTLVGQDDDGVRDTVSLKKETTYRLFLFLAKCSLLHGGG